MRAGEAADSGSSAGVPLLWVTRAALADIGLEALSGPSFDLHAQQRRHDILKRFARQRALDPRGTQLTEHVTGDIYNLHARNPIRGVTWFDEQAHVVFLLAVSLTHDYAEFTKRSFEGTLMPTARDYADVAQHRDPFSAGDEDFFTLAEADAEVLVGRAVAKPGELQWGILAQELPVFVQVEIIVIGGEGVEGDIYAALRLVDRCGNVDLPPSIVSDLADVLFPSAAPVDVDLHHDYFPPPRGKQAHDVVIRWRRP